MIYLIGTVLGFLFWKFTAGEYEGDKIEKSFRFIVKEYYIHIHHWIWCSFLLITFLLIGFRNEFVLGFLLGSVLQGLLYRDRFFIVYPTDSFGQIYSSFKDDTPTQERVVIKEIL